MVKESKVNLRPIKYENANIKIRGITPILMEKDDGFTAKHYEDKKVGHVIKEDKRTEEERVAGKIHYVDQNKTKVGYPAAAFHNAMRIVAYTESGNKGNISMLIKEGVRFLEPIIPLEYDEMIIREDIGKTKGKSKCPRRILRPQFNGWSCILKIRYEPDLITLEQVVDLVNKAGSRRGVGAWRPEKGGNFGTYEVDRYAK